MPLPSWITTTPGHGGSTAGRARKYGTAISITAPCWQSRCRRVRPGYGRRMADIDPLAQFRLGGRVAMVRGASSGIGARAAQVLDALGATVVVSARRTDRIEALAAS